jgi:hypothetical protein
VISDGLHDRAPDVDVVIVDTQSWIDKMAFNAITFKSDLKIPTISNED